ncbi:sugar-binding domain-containing protein [Agrococcus sp. ARC_14]|uniref:sugar-binding transcriptional regulator n=1 Tax=Agrococcus sp. ARC_14 TaxID=2919927 RepID=UPI001F054627|nr:sugar-binding domain-containing protein [Agrococcus sp. ARC_14]MCH1883930.1 transcriptional regulator [Agrococcus sp. ARC_14]
MSPSSNADDGLDRGLAVRAARAFYVADRSKIEIAKDLGISRFKVARLLEHARASGIVSIAIDDSGFIDEERSAALRERLGIERAVVVAAHGDDDEVRHTVGRAAASLLSETLTHGEVLGMGWGRTLSATAQELGPLPQVSVVQLTGATEMTRHLSPVEIVRAMSLSAGGEVLPIFAPLLTEDAETAALFRRQPAIHRVLERFDAVTTAVMAVGSWSPPMSQLFDSIEPSLRESLLERGVVAEVGTTLVDSDGQELAPDFSERCISISAEQIKAVPRVLGVAMDARKALALTALTAGGWITEVVVDETLADAVLAGPRR